jgi:hypothetical protein
MITQQIEIDGSSSNFGNPNFDGLNTYGDESRIFVPYGAVRGNFNRWCFF